MAPQTERVAVVVCKPAGNVLFTHCANRAAAVSIERISIGYVAVQTSPSPSATVRGVAVQ